jgi:hypothetical protein
MLFVRPSFKQAAKLAHIQVLFDSFMDFLLKLRVIKVPQQFSQSLLRDCPYLVSHDNRTQGLTCLSLGQKNLSGV